MTEQQLRQKIVDTAVAWLGCKESDGSHKKIIDVLQLPQAPGPGYAVKYTDAWCRHLPAPWPSKAGMTDIIPPSAGAKSTLNCSRKLGGLAGENDAHTPEPGDYIFTTGTTARTTQPPT